MTVGLHGSVGVLCTRRVQSLFARESCTAADVGNESTTIDCHQTTHLHTFDAPDLKIAKFILEIVWAVVILLL